jgi:hypothetical protein
VQQRGPGVLTALSELAAAVKVHLQDIESHNTLNTLALEATCHLGPDFPKADKA